MKDEELYTKEELELFKKIENGDFKQLSKKAFEKEKKNLKKIAANTIKIKGI